MSPPCRSPLPARGLTEKGRARRTELEKSNEIQFYLSVKSFSACWKRFLPSREGPSASACETSALTFVKKFCGEAPRGAGQRLKSKCSARSGACPHTRP